MCLLRSELLPISLLSLFILYAFDCDGGHGNIIRAARTRGYWPYIVEGDRPNNLTMAPNNGKSEHLLDNEESTDSQTLGTPDEAVNGTMQTIAGVMGNVLEWYDFALFGFFSDIIATVFFAPSEDAENSNNDDEIDTSNLIRSFSVYGGAFLMRPVGGLVIGYIGDKYGRKKALVLVR